MIFQRLRVFVSSKMQELAPERQAVKTALDALKVDAWVFEQDAGARPESIQTAFLQEVESADLYIGLFWKGYGDYTIEEYEHARKLGRDCLIYEKRTELNGQRDPLLQAFLDRLGNVENGLTIKWFNDPRELNEAIKDDVARWQAWKVRERGTPRINVNLSLAEKKERDELLILLRKVKQFWVEGFLEKSVHGQALIELGKEAWTEGTEHPWEQVLELPDHTSRTIRPGEPIDKIFDNVGRSLLILGAPGSGKTITLLDLTRQLISRAENDPAQPIPVVFNLSSWINPKQDLLDWLIDELLAKYQVPKKIGRRWLEANWIVPMFDGLDEVMTANQVACVKAINAYVQDSGAPGIAVCSRLKEYTDLPVRLQVTSAICLQPLTSEQVKHYLARSTNNLAGLKAALDTDGVLQTLAETPLMLDVMSLAYRDLPAEELTRSPLHSEKERRSHLIATYIGKMFARKGKGMQGYPREHGLKWLSGLARGMQQHSQTVFLIEQLQPSWLTTRRHRVVYVFCSRMVFGAALGLILGLYSGMEVRPSIFAGVMYFGLIPGLIDERRLNRGSLWARIENASPRRQTVMYVLIYGLIFGVLTSNLKLSIALPSTLALGLLFGLRARRRSPTNDIKSVETLRWSLAHARKVCAIGVISGLLFGLIYALSNSFSAAMAIVGLGFGLLWGLFGGIVGAFFGGLRGGMLDVKVSPNLGIKLSMRNGVLAGGLGLLVFLLVVVLIMWPLDWLLSMLLGPLIERLSGRAGAIGTLNDTLIFWLFVGVLLVGPIFAVIAFFWYGGQEVIQHYILRLILYWKGDTPLRYAKFLDYASRLVFLQKVGGGYIFIHRLLLEHFAAMRTESGETLILKE